MWQTRPRQERQSCCASMRVWPEGCRGEEGIVGEQRYYLYCNHRQLAHNVRTMPKYKPFWWLAQKVSSMCTKQQPAGVQATQAFKQQVHKFKISPARLQCTHTHTNFVYTSLNKHCIYRVYSPGTPARAYVHITWITKHIDCAHSVKNRAKQLSARFSKLQSGMSGVRSSDAWDKR